MSKLRIFYFLALTALGVLIVLAIGRPLAAGRDFSEVQRGHLLRAEKEWVIQFDIVNHEGIDIIYIINSSTPVAQNVERFLVPDGGVYTFIHHIPYEREVDQVNYTIFKEGEQAPFEMTTYYLDREETE